VIKILFTIPNFNTAGSGQAMLNIALGLNREKFEPHIACKTNEGDFFKIVEQSGIQIHIFDYEPNARPIQRLLKESWKVSRILKEINPSIVHSFHYNNNYPEAIAARLAGAKWIFTKKNMNWGNDGARSWRIRSALASRIITQNTEMQRRFYPKSTKTRLIERGIDVNHFAPQAPNAVIRKAAETPIHARVIAMVANLVPVKGASFAIEAFFLLANSFPNWHLWIIGDNETQTGSKLMARVRIEKLEKRIHFTGKVQNVRQYLDHAEIFLLPTRAAGEGSPVALIEAMANGKVVLGTEVPGISDQLSRKPNHLVPAEDSAALAKGLERFMKNDKETNKILGGSFQKFANANYTIQREVKKHEQVYLELIN
jgi:glycosyltransferase involved in cell wall biosynthesis